MKSYPTLLLFILCTMLASCVQPKPDQTIQHPDGPLALLEQNPHYFYFRGKPLVLITSAEHYGAVLNKEFDFDSYLQTLKTDGMNYTRIFTGSYFEIYGDSFGIQKNTLAPKAGQLIVPWKYEVNTDSTYTFDINTWDEAYFDRLKEFIRQAAKNDVIVEVTLFSSIYRDEHWDISPENPLNWQTPASAIPRRDAHTMNNKALLEVQEAYVKKIVTELNSFDNFFFEIQNEPWSDRTVPVYNIMNIEELKENDWTTKSDFADEQSLEWQTHLAKLITETEAELPKRHLIAQNYFNFRASIPEISEYISIINFHYAWPEAAAWNYHFNKVLGFDESGFAGSSDLVYRRQAWQFIFSGGALFNNLDYSFFPGYETGTGTNTAPGGGSKTLRNQLSYLSQFIHEFPLEDISPDHTSVCASPGLIPYVLSDSKETWGAFVRSTGTNDSHLTICIPDGMYDITIMSTLTGEHDISEIAAADGQLKIPIRIPDGEIALRIDKKSP